jgi:long-chain fatty acid transport protein
MMKYPHKVMTWFVAAALAVLAAPALAGGFGIGTQSGSGTGNAFAGGAAAADDASVAWYNPAAMTLLPSNRQAAAAIHLIRPSFKFTNTGSTGAMAGAGTGEGGDGGDWAAVPNGFYTMSINPRLKFGLALNAPFGLSTEYDPGWRGRFTAVESSLRAININPSLGYKVSDTLSIGGGISIQRLDATLSGIGAAGLVTNKGDDTGFGYNVGMIAQITPSTRIGATYRSAIGYVLEGTVTVSGNAAANGNIKADIKVPDSASLSLFSTLSPKWELMGDITWTGWSDLKRLDILRTTASAGGGVGSTVSTLLFNWKDTIRLSAGANYRLNEQTKLRFGVALDPTPTNDVDRTPRLPDQDRRWLAFGVQYKPSKQGIFDIGYAHEFIKDARVSTTVTGAGTLNGYFRSRADILSLQYTHTY